MNNRVGFEKRIAGSEPFCQIGTTDRSPGASVQLPAPRQARRPAPAGHLRRGATVTTRYERIKMHRRMQRRIQLVVEERRMAVAHTPRSNLETPFDPEATVEIWPR